MSVVPRHVGKYTRSATDSAGARGEVTQHGERGGRSYRAILRGSLRGPGRPPLWYEVVLIGLGYGVYTLIQGAAPAERATALRRAVDVLDLERAAHIDIELPVNHAFAAHPWLCALAGYYYATLHFAVPIGVLVWLYVRHPRRYRQVRSVLLTASVVALVAFWAFPLAPPRFLTARGFVDTAEVFHTWGAYDSATMAAVSNQYAAMPSLHIGWSLWAAVALVMLARRWWSKVLGVLHPMVTFLIILGTANHFVLDAVGGAAVVGCGLSFQRLASRRPVFAAQKPSRLTSARGHASGDGPGRRRKSATVGTTTSDASSTTK